MLFSIYRKVQSMTVYTSLNRPLILCEKKTLTHVDYCSFFGLHIDVMPFRPRVTIAKGIFFFTLDDSGLSLFSRLRVPKIRFFLWLKDRFSIAKNCQLDSYPTYTRRAENMCIVYRNRFVKCLRDEKFLKSENKTAVKSEACHS